MAATGGDSITDNHEKELGALKRRRRIGMLRVLIIGAICFGILLLASTLLTGGKQSDFIDRTREQLIASGLPWVRDYLSAEQYYANWLNLHGTRLEERGFVNVSRLIITSARISAGVDAQLGIGFVSSTLISLHFGLLRVTFIILACLRLWIALVLVGGVLGLLKLRAHDKRDLLGLTGNGRMFFSGIRVDVRKTASNGAPNMHITGLACPPILPCAEVRACSFGQMLDRYGATNETNQALAGVILANKEFPAYLVYSEEEVLLREAFAGGNLADNAEPLVEAALHLHAHYRAELASGEEEIRSPEFPEATHLATRQGKFTSIEYAHLLARALDRVCTPTMRREIAAIAPSEIALAFLAFEAGKVLAYRFESGHWIKKSNYPQLCARAVMQSMPSYGLEFAYERRMLVRRALVYASRHGVFGSVRFPVDLMNDARALRQWMEILLAAPHALQSVADEVELFGIVCEAHALWSQRFLDGVMTSSEESTDGVYASTGNLLFVPVSKLLSSVRAVVPATLLQRMEELVFMVSQRQRLQAMSLELGSESEQRIVLPSYERVFVPLTHQHTKTLSEQHGVSTTDLRQWSSVRVIFNSFGWLGRRVGDYTVPESSIVFAVLKSSQPLPGANERGAASRPGMVPLRATRVEARLGRTWRSRFVEVIDSQMAETTADLEKVMRGVQEPPTPLDDFSATAQS